MENPILRTEVQDFITKSTVASISKLALQKNPFPNIEWISILNQIEAKSKAREKLPTWFNTSNIIYPGKISVEQTSSEKTALYKSNLVSGESLIDLSGGFGVDDYYFSKKIKSVVHCEINQELSNIVRHNVKQLQANNIECIIGDSLDTLKNLNREWDWIYIDPSRRSESKGKVFMLKDCLPNVPENIDYYFQKSPNILIKTAPLLDISAALTELNNVKEIHIVALENEVKELLFELHKEYRGKITIKTINLKKDTAETFDYILGDRQKIPNFSLPQKYLYEPNSAIMKSGGFEEVGLFYNLNKLHKHSHLYTSADLILFPGRVFEVLNSFDYNKEEMKKNLSGKQINITTRNFPESVEQIRKKWKIKEGGNLYTFFTIDINNNKKVLLCNKIK